MLQSLKAASYSMKRPLMADNIKFPVQYCSFFHKIPRGGFFFFFFQFVIQHKTC